MHGIWPSPRFSVYRTITHVSAEIRLADRGKMVKEGEVIEFVHVDSKNHNPLCRVAPIEAYDRESITIT